MARPKKPKTRADQPRNSRAVRELKEDLGLDEADWQEFLRHAIDGFADYEKASFFESDEPLRLRDAPDEWFDDPTPLGYVTLRVLREGNPDLAIRVAWFFLQSWDVQPNDFSGPPGIGPSWLYLSREGVEAPVDPAGLARLALQIPEDFFKGITEGDLIPLCRIIVESKKPLDVWDLHALLAAVTLAKIPGRAAFHVFNDLMEYDGVSPEVKRELCRGVLECPAEFQRICERANAVRASMQTDDGLMRTPRMYLEIRTGGAGGRHPGLKRHAVRALVENLGEPLEGVISEFFLKDHGDTEGTNAVSEGVLDLIRIHAEELGPEVVKRRLSQGIKKGAAAVRQAAYRVGLERFGPAFTRPAFKDPARLVRDWAAKALFKDKPKRGSKSRSPKIAPGNSPDD
jgi:hypothetical protein